MYEFKLTASRFVYLRSLIIRYLGTLPYRGLISNGLRAFAFEVLQYTSLMNRVENLR